MSSGVEMNGSNELSVDQSLSQAVHRIVQFLRVVRSRIRVIFVALAVAALLGGFYYATAMRLYRADAKILILQNGDDDSASSMGGGRDGKRNISTYQELLRSAVVLQGVHDAVDPKHRIDFEGSGKGGSVGVVARNLALSVVKKTNIIQISYMSKDPDAAVAVVNALLQSYFEFIDSTHRNTSRQIAAVLEKEKDELEAKLQQKERELIAAREGFGALGGGADGAVTHTTVQRAMSLNEHFIEAHQERLRHQAALSAVQTAVRNGADLQQHLMAAEESVGRAVLLAELGISNRDVNTKANLERALLKDRTELETLSNRLGENHPRLVEVRERIRLNQEYLESYGDRASDQLSSLQASRLGPALIRMMEQALINSWQREKEARASFTQAHEEAMSLNKGMTQIELLERSVERMRSLHDVLVDRIANIDLRQDYGEIRATVVKPAQATRAPVFPRLRKVVGTCVIGALVVGGLIIFIQDALDDRFRSPEDVTMRLGTPTLAMISQLEPIPGHGMETVQAFVNPTATESEAFRTLRTALTFNADETRRLVVSSTEPGDGKTTVLANTGVTIAQSGKKVLLIDADLRRPGLTALFEMKRENGLSDVLRSDEPIADVASRHIRGLEQEGLDVLPSGPRRPNPAELLSSERLGDLLAWAETHYDQILVDSPPVLAASDAMILGRIADGLMLVINPDKNRRRLVTRAYESVIAMGVNVIGIVANRIDANSAKGYGYGYGYSYSYQYGGTEEEMEEINALTAEADSEMHQSQDNVMPFSPSSPAAVGAQPVVPRKIA